MHKPESILKAENTSLGHVQRANDTIRQLDTVPNSTGRELLKKYLTGTVLTNAQSVKAKCCECSGFYIDGKKDCEVYTCPLYPYMPYGKMRKKYIRPDRIKGVSNSRGSQ